MSQLLNKLTNLVVGKITDESLIQTKSYGQPAIIIVDEEKGLRYGPKDYEYVQMGLKQGIGDEISYLYCSNPNVTYAADIENRMVAQTATLYCGVYTYDISNVVVTIDENNQIYADSNAYENKEDRYVILKYQGEDEIIINMKIYQKEENNSGNSGGEPGK